MDKKKLLAVLIFLIMGLFMFTSANPGNHEYTPVDGNNNESTTNESTTTVPEKKDDAVVAAPVINLDAYNDTIVVYDALPNFYDMAKAAGTGNIALAITTDADNNKVGTYTVTFVAKDVYGNTTTIAKKFFVNKRVLTVAIDNASAIYGNDVKELTYTVTGKEVTENPAGITLATTVTKESNVGKYAITGTYTNDNYDVTFTDGIYNIDKKELSHDDLADLSFKNMTATFDGTEHTITVTNAPAYVDVTYTNNTRTNVGTSNAVAIVTAKEDSNYTGSVELTANLTVTPATVTVDWTNTTFTYDGNSHKPSATIKDVNGTTVVLAVSGEQTEAGTYTATTTVTDPNYSATNTTCEFTINNKTITEDEIVFNGATYTYNGNTHALTAVIPSYINVVYENNNKVNAGTYEVTATFTGTGDYTGTIVKKATLTINPASAEVVWTDNNSLVYDGTDKMASASALDIKGNALPLVLNPERAINAGTYNVTATTTDSNYVLTNTTHSFTIAKADPEYTLPEVTIYENESLSNGLLTEGFTFDNVSVEVVTPIIETTVTYTPSDTTNYNTISNIPLTVNVREKYFTVRFLDYYGNVLSTQSVRYRHGAVAPTTGYAQDITLSNGTVLSIPTWDKDFSNITSDLDVEITYKNVASGTTTAYILKDGVSMPDPIYAPNSSDNYSGGINGVGIKDDGTGSLAKVVVAAKKSKNNEAYLAVGDDVYKYITADGLEKINSISGENYKIVWYVLKYNTGDGWHLDGYREYTK